MKALRFAIREGGRTVGAGVVAVDRRSRYRQQRGGFSAPDFIRR